MIYLWKQQDAVAEKQIDANKTLSWARPTAQLLKLSPETWQVRCGPIGWLLPLPLDHPLFGGSPVNQAVLFQALYGCTDVTFKVWRY